MTLGFPVYPGPRCLTIGITSLVRNESDPLQAQVSGVSGMDTCRGRKQLLAQSPADEKASRAKALLGRG